VSANDPYADGALYDLEYADMTEDVDFYVQRASEAEGPVVELGCGTGRLTIPIARAGIRVTGVEASPAMLARLRAKLGREEPAVQDRITLRAESWETFRPDEPADVVLWPFNALHHCRDEAALRDVLAHVRSYVRPEGRLALDAYLPDPVLYGRDPDRRYEPRTFVDPATGESLESWEQGWWDEREHVHNVLYVYRSRLGERRTHLRLRMFEVERLRAIVGEAGWRIVTEASDFAGAPVGRDALKWVAMLAREG
jgi:SAM-dependent methyltransferase